MWRGRAGALPAAIGALCRALPPGSRPAPETFRLAKFDRPEASLQIWRLLYSLLKQIHDGGWTEPDTIGTQIRFVKSVLWYHGYGRPEFYQLPSDGSQGSRELLLAFSWLLNRISLLERLLTVNRVKTGDEASVCTCEDNISNNWKDRTEIALEPCLKRDVDVRYLQWLTGRLRFQWRSLHVDHQEQCKLLHKIHSYTSGCHMDQTIGHFSITETDLIRQPDSYKQLLQLLESETSRLEAFLEWKRLEPVYWHWMETVLDILDEDANTFKSEDVCKEKNTSPNANLCCHSASNIIGEIDKLTKDLVTLRDGVHELVTCKKSAWYEKVKSRERTLPDEKEFCAAVRTITEAVKLKLSDLKYHCAHKKNGMHGLYRLVFKDKHSASKTGFLRSVSKEPSTNVVNATEVISELQMEEATLKRELKRLQEECRHKLDEIAEGLVGVICIPPMKR
ncbi:tubulin epsilon and delta complex protein 1 [Gopherus flavomarginatus]|uniref:tubulin epsilon and delta complex protein 1 n=1 Tax=Gopherus flavomarginatus TaxID=286002 RepID=UPI0021CC2BD3|nr:tubulin epsilon and delta complex protein 1 [Gopherus flavomarginatus]